MPRIRTYLDCLNAVSLRLAAGLLLVMTFALCVNLLSRDFIGSSFVGVDALSAYFTVWITFIGSAVIVPSHGHVSIDILLRMTGGRTRRVIYFITAICGMGGSLYIAIFGLKITFFIFNIGVEEPTIGISKAYLFLIPSVASLLMFINYLFLLIDTVLDTSPAPDTSLVPTPIHDR